jgi:hypothetical protein
MVVLSRRSYARIGLLGNPSDGYHGRTISVLIENFYAEACVACSLPRTRGVVLWFRRPCLFIAQVTLESTEDGSVHFVPHPEHDTHSFASLADFSRAGRSQLLVVHPLIADADTASLQAASSATASTAACASSGPPSSSSTPTTLPTAEPCPPRLASH